MVEKPPAAARISNIVHIYTLIFGVHNLILLKIGKKNIVPPRNHILKQPRYLKSVHYYGNAQKVYSVVLKKKALYISYIYRG